jgi:prepilin-type N-terminal cleavage/methylation domain-containing protein
MTSGNSSAAGFTLIELLVGSAVALVVIALSCQLAVDVQVAWRSAAARVDLQQRTRVAVDVLSRALHEAGGGPLSGAARGNLMRGVPSVLPRRVGRRRAHAFDEFTTAAFTVIRAVADAEHGVLLTPAPPGATTVELSPAAGCALPACGFANGASVILLTGSGLYDIFTVTAVDGMALTVRHHGGGGSAAYPAGTPVLAAESTSFTLDESGTLRVYDGDSNEVPLLDDVVGLQARYFGVADQPVWPRPPGGEANCLYAADGTYHSALVPILGTPGTLVELTAALLTDGPWCGSGDTRFDADLLRIRLIRLSIRLQADDPAVRGADRTRFAHPGAARRSALAVPDAAVEIDVAPRNLRLE